MSASIKKLFRESHRNVRLRPMRPGHCDAEEVRPLSLTPALEKIINIKDTVVPTLHEDRIIAAASPLSQN
jgi:hypothetical protein